MQYASKTESWDKLYLISHIALLCNIALWMCDCVTLSKIWNIFNKIIDIIEIIHIFGKCRRQLNFSVVFWINDNKYQKILLTPILAGSPRYTCKNKLHTTY